MLKYISSGIGITFRLVPLCLLSTIVIGSILGMIQFRRIPVLSSIISGKKMVTTAASTNTVARYPI